MSAALFLVLPAPAEAAPDTEAEAAGGGQGGEDWPWKRFNLSIGGLVATSNSSVSLGQSAVGLEVRPEEILGLDTSLFTFAVGADYRLGRLPRHRISISYTMFRRSGTRTIEREITLRDQVFVVGMQTDTRFDTDFARLGYDYSVVHDSRMDLSVGLGLYAIPLRFSVEGTRPSGEFERVSEDIIAPLPALALRGGFAISERWFLYANLDVTYVAAAGVKIRYTDVRTALEWRFVPPVAVGVGFEGRSLSIEATKPSPDWPGLDFFGAIGLEHTGAFLYLALHL